MVPALVLRHPVHSRAALVSFTRFVNNGIGEALRRRRLPASVCPFYKCFSFSRILWH